jgi:MoaA/NifB/PqqE/SkfB family radical SAM enzyme
MKFSNEQKDQLLNKSKSFCMIPWVSIHTTPTGVAVHCCIANQNHPVGNANQMSMMELVNSEKMNDLRRDMLDGIKNPLCNACYSHEDQGIRSFRQTSNQNFRKYFNESLASTDVTGELGNFKMRYFDLRLSNICNMKCRTCNSHYSSQWENEDAKQGATLITIDKINKNKYIEDILSHIPYMDVAYFAGGEPLITEEHYIMLEEMIRLGRTDIELRYNTNLSALKYKDKDLLDLWSHFKTKIQVYASLDDFGPRAEYIRSGTNWEQIEKNFKKLKTVSFVNIQINSVLSIFNFVTFSEFYHYLLDNGLYTPKDHVFTIYNMISPVQLTALALPMHLKIQGIEGITNVIERMKNMAFHQGQIQQLDDAKKWVLSDNTWEKYREDFIKETNRLDILREEKFADVFPELAELIE